MTVYIVTQGDYSDYSIQKVFMDREKAELYVKYHKGSHIEEYETYDDCVIDHGYYKINATFQIIKNYKGVYSTTQLSEKWVCSEKDGISENYYDTYLDSDGYWLSIYRYYDDRTTTLEDAKSKTSKVGQDLCAEISVMLSQGMSTRDIKRKINSK